MWPRLAELEPVLGAVQAVGFRWRVVEADLRREDEGLAAVAAILLMAAALVIASAVVMVDILVGSAVGAFEVAHGSTFAMAARTAVVHVLNSYVY